MNKPILFTLIAIIFAAAMPSGALAKGDHGSGKNAATAGHRFRHRHHHRHHHHHHHHHHGMLIIN